MEIMFAPLVACLILTGIHTYLGIHVIRRGVIFVDLALAQMAALGATVGYLFGFKLHSTGSYMLSLTFAMSGAALFALSRFRQSKISQEAVIGVVYAVAGAAAILVLSEAPEGGEELRALLVGHLLFVSWEEIAKMLLLYSLVGAVHWKFRQRFFAITDNPKAVEESGQAIRWWDFLFYATFAVVVTSSVELAGVLLVFCFLTVPALCGIAWSDTTRTQLIIGWAVGFFASLLGMGLSYYADLPTGAAVVCVLGAALLVALGLLVVRSNRFI